MTDVWARARSRPERIGPYTVTRALGHGACGVVYAAVDERGAPVALKTMYAGFSPRRFERECRILQTLQHPNIVSVRGTVTAGERTFLVMDQIEGRSLQALLDAGRVFTCEEVVRVALALCDALHYAHRLGVVHRDVSAGNILFDERAPRLLDFGIARGDEDTLITQNGEILGTPGYLAPEVIEGAPAGPAADQFGLGRTLFEMSCERPPNRPQRGILGVLTASLDLDWTRVRRGDAWNRIFPVLRKMLSRAAADRYPNMGIAGADWAAAAEVIGRPRRGHPPPPLALTEDTLVDISPRASIAAAAAEEEGETEIAIRRPASLGRKLG